MKSLIFSILFIATTPIAYAQTAEWVQTIANGGAPTNAAVDKAGNVYSAGKGNASLTVGSITSPGAGMYLCKNNAAGVPIWMARSVSTSGYNVRQIVTDSRCNVYVRGSFSDSVQFGNLPQLNVPSYLDYIVKYDSSGNAVWDSWIIPGGGVSNMAIDDSDNLIVGGSYLYGAYFGSYIDTLPQTNTWKGFIVKYSGNNGSLLWKRYIDAHSIDDLASDKDNNIYVTGTYYSAFTIDGITLNLVGGNSSYVAKLDSNGYAQWAQPFNITGNSSITYSAYVTSNGKGGCFLTGNIGSSAVFDNINLSPTSSNVFMARYADDGTLQWAQNISNGYLLVTGSSADTAGNIFLSLRKDYQGGNSMFGNNAIPAPDTTGNVTMIAAETDTAGTPLWAIYGMLNNGSNNILPPSVMDNTGNIYMTGACSTGGGSIVFSNQTTTMPSYGNFLAKLSPPPTAVPFTAKKPMASVFPNPASNMATVHFSSGAYDRITVTDALGKMVYAHAIGKGQQEVVLNVSGYAAGAYFIELSGNGGNVGNKLVVGK